MSSKLWTAKFMNRCFTVLTLIIFFRQYTLLKMIKCSGKVFEFMLRLQSWWIFDIYALHIWFVCRGKPHTFVCYKECKGMVTWVLFSANLLWYDPPFDVICGPYNSCLHVPPCKLLVIAARYGGSMIIWTINGGLFMAAEKK